MHGVSPAPCGRMFVITLPPVGLDGGGLCPASGLTHTHH